MQNQIPKNWQRVKLGEVADVKGGKRLPMGFSVQDKETNHPYLRIVDMNEAGLDTSDIKYISDEVFKRISRYTISDKDLYISIAGTIGFVGKIPQFLSGANLTENCAKICNFSENLDRDFLLYFLMSYQGKAEIKAGTGGSSQPKLALCRIENFLLALPPKGLQQKIASILSNFDNKIELNNKIAKTLEQMAQTLFWEWFVSGDLQEWKTSKFENYARLEYGKALQEGKRISGEVLVFGSSGQIGTHNEKICSGPGIVVGRKGNVGSVFWVDEDFYPIDTTFYVKSEISLYYIYFTLKNMRFHTGDSAVPGLNRESVHSTEILIPDKNILDKFDEIASPMFKTLAEIEKENQKLAALRDLLLPKLMKGEILVNN